MPWFAWIYNSYLWPYGPKELVVIDSSDGEESADLLRTLIPPGELNLVRVKTGMMKLGRFRNEALAAATGDFITWMDDDDWRHPRFSVDMVEQAPGGLDNLMIRCALPAFLMVNIDSMRWYMWPRRYWWGGVLCRLAWVRSAGMTFKDKAMIGEDSAWMAKVERLRRINRQAAPEVRVPPEKFIYVRHGNKTSFVAGNIHAKPDGTHPLLMQPELRGHIMALRERLGLPPLPTPVV